MDGRLRHPVASRVGNSFPVEGFSLNPLQMPRKAPVIDPDQAIPKPGSMDRPLTPRPREQKVINALVSGQAKTLSAAMVQAGFNPTSQTVRNRFLPDGDLRQELNQALETAGITMPFMLLKLFAKLDAKKNVAIGKQAIETDDNDAQLRALEIAIKLHDRTGKLPTAQEGSSGSNITVNVLVMGEKSET